MSEKQYKLVPVFSINCKGCPFFDKPDKPVCCVPDEVVEKYGSCIQKEGEKSCQYHIYEEI